MEPITIDNILELAIRNCQNNFRDEERLKQCHTQLLAVCYGIVAGIRAGKEAPYER